MKKKRIWFYLGFLMVFLAIFSFHGYFNVKAIIVPPSDMWGRDSVLGTTYFKKTVALTADKNTVTLFAAEKDSFSEKVVSIQDNKTISTKQYNPGMKSDKLVKYTKVGSFIIWTENYDLYVSDISSEGTRKKLQEKVNDFKILPGPDGVILLTATDTGISAFHSEGSGFVKNGPDYVLEKPRRLSAGFDNRGVAHIIAIAKREDVNYLFKYIKLDHGKWQEGAEYLNTDVDIKAEVTNPQVVSDDKRTYLFYEIGKRDKNGIAAKTYYAPVATELKFQQLTLDPDEYNENNFLNEFKPVYEGQDGVIKAVAVKRNGKNENEGYRVICLNFKDGKVQDYLPVTLNKLWIGDVSAASAGEDLTVAFLQRKNDDAYDVFYSNTNPSYKVVANRITFNDILVGFGNVLPAYAVGVFVIATRIIIFVPALIWLLLVEFFEFRKFIANPKLTFNIAFGIFTVMKVFTINLYYKATAVAMMPVILKFGPSKYIVILLTTLVAYGLTKYYRKTNPDISVNVEFFIYALLDIFMISLIYSPYLIF